MKMYSKDDISSYLNSALNDFEKKLSSQSTSWSSVHN